jgi:hypothetical protein
MVKRLKIDFSDGVLKLSFFLPLQRDLILITPLICPMRSHFIHLDVYPLPHLRATVGVLYHHQCVRGYFSHPSQRPSTVKSPRSTCSYSSSAMSSTPYSPSPLDSPPSPLDSPPSPPITPTVLPPPIRAHSHSPLHQFSRHVFPSSKPTTNSKTQPPTAPPHPTHHIYASSSNSLVHIFKYRRMKQFHNQA